MAEFKKAVQQYQELSKEWAKGRSRDSAKVSSYLTQLKMSLTGLTFLPTGEEASTKEAAVCRDTLEIGAQHAVSLGDTKMFERYMAQLLTYYYDYNTTLPDSAFKYQLLGLNLLCLLSQNRVSEFHTELERLPSSELSNVYIKHPVSLEQYIMEGSYNKVLSLKGNVPAESYNFFFDILLNTVREEIASCLEKAYKTIGCADAGRMLNLSAAEMTQFGRERKWQVRGERFVFRSEAKQQEEGGVPSLELANMAISYAREMEQIV